MTKGQVVPWCLEITSASFRLRVAIFPLALKVKNPPLGAPCQSTAGNPERKDLGASGEKHQISGGSFRFSSPWGLADLIPIS